MNRLTRGEANRCVARALERHKKGQLKCAYHVYRKVLAQFPNHPTAIHYLGLIAQQTGHAQEAVRLLQRSIQLDPSDPRAYNHLGQVVLGQNRISDAVYYFEQALAIDPRHVDSLNNLANVIGRHGDLARAIEIYRRALETDPRASHSAYNLANAFKQVHQYDDALHWFERAIAAEPGHFQAHHNRAVLLEQKGRFDEAIEHYTAALRINPKHIKALANLIAIRSYRPDRETIELAEVMLNQQDLDDEDRIKLHQGLGKHLDRAGSYDNAFRHFENANIIQKRRRGSFELGTVVRYFDRIIATFSADYFANPRCGSNSQRPVFVVGMPRSGTTLVEQILASHPSIFGAGELQEIPKIVKCLLPAYPEGVADTDDRVLAKFASQYLAALEDLAPTDAARVIDKLPVNFTHLGLIATLFPGARIIYCRRDPRDIGLSCFIEQFDMKRDFTTDLEHFGQYFLQHERLMAHWKGVLPLWIYEQRYEDLIADQQAHSRALVANCGLEWNEACLEFQKADRVVLTPSRWQVRQPIYKSSAGKWRNYAAHIAPLEHLLRASGYRYT